jgi:hypothetical protein
MHTRRITRKKMSAAIEAPIINPRGTRPYAALDDSARLLVVGLGDVIGGVGLFGLVELPVEPPLELLGLLESNGFTELMGFVESMPPEFPEPPPGTIGAVSVSLWLAKEKEAYDYLD